jgi:signal transduction histidine kinase
LGLYIVKSLVALMNGSVELASRPGEGACFLVRLQLRLDPRDVAIVLPRQSIENAA